MKVLVTGAHGMLGSDWCQRLMEQGHQVVAAGRRVLDVTDLDGVRRAIGEHLPELVIHTAAHTDADRGEVEPQLPYRVNTVGTWNVALACRDCRAQLIYVSSCGVFDGKKRSPYTEMDQPRPLTEHHRSKLAAERIVTELVPEHFILRPGWLFGGRVDHQRNFVAKRLREAQGTAIIRSADDRFGSPTYTLDFADAAMRIVETQAFGLYHVANSGSCSRYQYVRECIDALGLPNDVVPVSSDSFPRSAPAPESEALENLCMELRGLPSMRSWQDALRHYIHYRLLPEQEGVA